MGIEIGPKFREFLGQRMLAVVCTLNARQAPEMTPIWYEYNPSDGCIWFNGDKSRQWLQRIEHAGHATFFLLDPQNAWRWAQIYGRVVSAEDDVDATHFARLGERYGRPIQRGTPNRRFLRVDITSVKGQAGSPRERWDTGAAS